MRTAIFLTAGLLLMASLLIVAKLFSEHYPSAPNLALGLGLSFTLIQALKSQGFNTFAIPVGGLVTVVVFGAAVGVIASIRPASKAAKLNVLEAISSE